MSDKLSEQADKMREMAQTTLDKAKDAVSKYIVESQKMRAKVDSSVQASYSSAKDMNEKAVAFAEANVVAGFELGDEFARAGTEVDGGREAEAFDAHRGPWRGSQRKRIMCSLSK